MNTQPILIGKRADGTLLGELDGVLYVGVPTLVGHDQVQREVAETDDGWRATYHVDGTPTGGETFAREYKVQENDGSVGTRTREEPPEFKPEKVMREVFVERDGVEVKEEREVKLCVTLWETLS